MAAARHFVTNPVAWAAVLLVAIYSLFGHAAPVRMFTEILIVAQIMASAWAMIAVGGVALRCFISPGWPHPDSMVGLGMFLTALGVNWNGAWALFYRLSGQAAWLINNDYYNAWRPIIIAGLVIKVGAIGIFGGHVPRGYKVRHGVFLFLAVLLILLLVLTSPNLRPIAEWLRPYLEEVRSIGSARPASRGASCS